MTKGEIVALLPNVTSQEEATQLAGQVKALDVCTPAEREFIEARMVLRRLPDGTDPVIASEVFQRFTNAEEAILAERTPPDPVETFIAEMRAHHRAYCRDELPAIATALCFSLEKLDAARRKPAPVAEKPCCSGPGMSPWPCEVCGKGGK